MFRIIYPKFLCGFPAPFFRFAMPRLKAYTRNADNHAPHTLKYPARNDLFQQAKKLRCHQIVENVPTGDTLP